MDRRGLLDRKPDSFFAVSQRGKISWTCDLVA
jgi:hypothetical protein